MNVKIQFISSQTQSKVTELVKDSSDDLWFLEEGDDRGDDDWLSDNVYADEYDLVSEVSGAAADDTDDDIIVSANEVRRYHCFLLRPLWNKVARVIYFKKK